MVNSGQAARISATSGGGLYSCQLICLSLSFHKPRPTLVRSVQGREAVPLGCASVLILHRLLASPLNSNVRARLGSVSHTLCILRKKRAEMWTRHSHLGSVARYGFMQTKRPTPHHSEDILVLAYSSAGLLLRPELAIRLVCRSVSRSIRKYSADLVSRQAHVPWVRQLEKDAVTSELITV